MIKIIAFAGLPMTGKSTAREELQKLLDKHNIPQTYLHLGSTEEVERRNAADEWAPEQKDLSMEHKERLVREQWRAEEGMGVMVRKKLPDIHAEIEAGKIVLIDNMYSDEEKHEIEKEFSSDSFLLVATVADWNVRVRRGQSRPYRPLEPQELAERDCAEIYNLNKAPTIALASVTLANNYDEQSDPQGARANLREELQKRVLPYLV